MKITNVAIAVVVFFVMVVMGYDLTPEAFRRVAGRWVQECRI